MGSGMRNGINDFVLLLVFIFLFELAIFLWILPTPFSKGGSLITNMILLHIGHLNVAPRHLTAEAETLLSANLIHEVMHVLGFDRHAFAHFRDERKRKHVSVEEQALGEKLGRMVTGVVLPRVITHSCYHYGVLSENFSALELEDCGGRGTSGSHWQKRLLMNEIVTGSVDTRSIVSKLTLALLEDSGWYRATTVWQTVLTAGATWELSLLSPLATIGKLHAIAIRHSFLDVHITGSQKVTVLL